MSRLAATDSVYSAGSNVSVVADALRCDGPRRSFRNIAFPQQVGLTVYTNMPEQHAVKEACTSFRLREVQTFKTEVVCNPMTIHIPRQATEEVQHTVYDVQTFKVPRTVVTHRPVYEIVTKQLQVPSVGYVDKVVLVPHTVRVPLCIHEIKDVQVKVPKIVHNQRTIQMPRCIQVPHTLAVQNPFIEYREKVVINNKTVRQNVTQTVMCKTKIPVCVQTHHSYPEDPAVSHDSGFVKGDANSSGGSDGLAVHASPAPLAAASAQDRSRDIFDELKRKNSHERDVRIIFRAEGHAYFIDGSANKFGSVTTWLELHFPSFDADAAIENMQRNPIRWEKSPYYGMSREDIKAIWATNAEKATKAGTAMHEAIELYYNAIECGGKNEKGEELGCTVDELAFSSQELQNEFSFFKNFVEVERQHGKMRPYRTEWAVFDEDAKIAGCIDMVFENLDGTLSIYDWKRCKNIDTKNSFRKFMTTPALNHVPDTNFGHYCLQLNVYKYILEKNYGKTVTRLCIVNLHSDNENFQLFEAIDLQDEVKKCLQAAQGAWPSPASGSS